MGPWKRLGRRQKDRDESSRCEGVEEEGERENQRVGDMEEGGRAGEEMIVDIQKGQPRYADHLLLEQQKVDSATKHLSSGPKALQHIEESRNPPARPVTRHLA